MKNCSIPQKVIDLCLQFNSKLLILVPDTQLDGMSELAVKVVKRIIRKRNDPYISLLGYLYAPLTRMAYLRICQLLLSRCSNNESRTKTKPKNGNLNIMIRM